MMLRRGLSRKPAALAVAMLTATASWVALTSGALPARAQSLPEIRMHSGNPVPACVTPRNLMRFLSDRNPRMEPKFRSIAEHYKAHGERLHVRWDYAFFQMIVETNYLLFRTETRRGDVSPSQNNFAGIGTTGGGVPGDRFPDVSTGVLGQMQHLIAYSGEWVERPVAQRTRDKQSDIISASRKLRRAVTFRDLAGRWAVDRRYARTIATVADTYHQKFCRGRPIEPDTEDVAPARDELAASRAPSRQAPGVSDRHRSDLDALTSRIASPPSTAARPAPAQPCKVFTASYGGTKNILIRRRVGDEIHYTALQVLDGRESGLAEAFIRSHAQGGEQIGEFADRDAALASAFHQCPESAAEAGPGRG